MPVVKASASALVGPWGPDPWKSFAPEPERRHEGKKSLKVWKCGGMEERKKKRGSVEARRRGREREEEVRMCERVEG
jgi:hypothetical protein